jgi:hypothetical protein
MPQMDNHYCFSCEKPFTVIFPIEEHIHKNPESCPTCGFFKCPNCGKCACDLSEEGRKVLNAFWLTFCSGSCKKRRR